MTHKRAMFEWEVRGFLFVVSQFFFSMEDIQQLRRQMQGKKVDFPNQNQQPMFWL